MASGKTEAVKRIVEEEILVNAYFSSWSPPIKYADTNLTLQHKPVDMSKIWASTGKNGNSNVRAAFFGFISLNDKTLRIRSWGFEDGNKTYYLNVRYETDE